ncbi:MAG: GNAT family N-acetyltransferase [Rhodobiaceae bacterium]|nr:GNAT family N-acetyltransferase [Rhodobiaceae bacterium]
MSNATLTIPTQPGEGVEIDHSDSSGDDFDALSRDLVPVRSMTADDLDAIVAIDRHVTGRNRRPFYERKLAESLEQAGVRVSLVAEIDGMAAGYLMARVDYGEFGQTEPEAEIDSIGVDPAYAHKHVGTALMSQLMANLSALQVERVRTEVVWDHYALNGFLSKCGFKPAQRLVLRRTI